MTTLKPLSMFVAHLGRPGDGLAGEDTAFGWAGWHDGAVGTYNPAQNHSIDALADAVTHAVAEEGRRVAVGVDAPLWAPLPDSASRLLHTRGDPDRLGTITSAWCGRYAVWRVVRTLQLLPWLLSAVASRLVPRDVGKVGTVNPDRWSAATPLLVFEAYVAGPAHRAAVDGDDHNTHVGDAFAALGGAVSALDPSGRFGATDEVDVVSSRDRYDGSFCWASAALLAAGLTDDARELGQTPLLVRPPSNRDGWAPVAP